MNQKVLSVQTLSIIDQYLNFKIGTVVCSIPYFNNKTKGTRAALRVYVGKGTPKEIAQEVEAMFVKNRIGKDLLTAESLKKFLVDNNLGIECSGFVFHVLNAEIHDRKLGRLEKLLHFPNCRGLFGKIRCHFRPVENCDVATFASEQNSRAIALDKILPGDFITMTNDEPDRSRDHILVIHEVNYQNDLPSKIHYSHSIAYPADGLYKTGVRQGIIEILDVTKPITQAVWTENGSVESVRPLFERAVRCRTEVRRLRVMGNF